MSRSIRAAAVFVVAIATCLLAAQSAFAGPGAPDPPDGVAIIRDDGGSNLVVVDPIRPQNTANFVYTLFGDSSTDQVVFGDWDGDGIKSLGIVRDAGGALLWIRDFTGNGSLVYDLFGSSATDMPVVGNWDASSPADELGVVRPNSGNNTLEWILQDNAGPAPCNCTSTLFGSDTDAPVPGEWDGDPNNGDELGIARSDGAGTLLWVTQGSGGLNYGLWGADTDNPVPGDYTGDGNSNFGVRQSSSNVYVLDGTTSPEYLLFGDAPDGFANPGNFGQP